MGDVLLLYGAVMLTCLVVGTLLCTLIGIKVICDSDFNPIRLLLAAVAYAARVLGAILASILKRDLPAGAGESVGGVLAELEEAILRLAVRSQTSARPIEAADPRFEGVCVAVMWACLRCGMLFLGAEWWVAAGPEPGLADILAVAYALPGALEQAQRFVDASAGPLAWIECRRMRREIEVLVSRTQRALIVAGAAASGAPEAEVATLLSDPGARVAGALLVLAGSEEAGGARAPAGLRRIEKAWRECAYRASSMPLPPAARAALVDAMRRDSAKLPPAEQQPYEAPLAYRLVELERPTPAGIVRLLALDRARVTVPMAAVAEAASTVRPDPVGDGGPRCGDHPGACAVSIFACSACGEVRLCSRCVKRFRASGSAWPPRAGEPCCRGGECGGIVID